LRWPFEINQIELRSRVPAAGTLIGFMNIQLERIANIILKKKQGTCCRYPAEEKIFIN